MCYTSSVNMFEVIRTKETSKIKERKRQWYGPLSKHTAHNIIIRFYALTSNTFILNSKMHAKSRIVSFTIVKFIYIDVLYKYL